MKKLIQFKNISILTLFILTMSLFGNTTQRIYDPQPVQNISFEHFYYVVGSTKILPNSKYYLNCKSFNTEEDINLDITLKNKNAISEEKPQKQLLILKSNETKTITFDIQNLYKPDLYLDIEANLKNKSYKNEVKLNYNEKLISTFIQTDKKIYKPGENVKIRVILVDSKLLPIDDSEKVSVFIVDPKKNRIKQWLNSSLENGLFSATFQLNEIQTLGEYDIHVESMGTQKKTKSFEVGEYVLPEFEVKINAPKYVYYDQSKITVTVDAKYLHGKPIDGLLNLTMKQRYYYPSIDHRFWPELKSIEKIEISKPIKGFTDVELNPVGQLRLNNEYETDIEIKAVVTENLTKKNFTETTFLTLAEKKIKIEVVDESAELKPGLPFETTIRIVDRNNELVLDKTNQVKLGYSFSYPNEVNDKFVEKNYSLESGLINFNIDVPINATSLYIRGVYKNQNFNIHQFDTVSTTSGRYIQLQSSDKKYSFLTGQKLNLVLNSTHSLKEFTILKFKYNTIISSENVLLDNPSNKHEFYINITHELAPSFDILVFYFSSDNDIVYDKKKIIVEDLFLTPLELKSNTNKSEPGQKVSINVKTSPNAYVGLLGVDQGVLLLKSGNDITKSDILNDIQEYGEFRHHYRSWNSFYQQNFADMLSKNNLFCVMNGIEINNNYFHPFPKKISVSRTALFGMQNLESNTLAMAMPASIQDSSYDRSYSHSKKIIKVRKEFPETWLWLGKKADSVNGEATFDSKVPDTITSWIVSAFALDKKTGLAVTDDNLKITVVKPFFLKMNLPYSIVRGEIATIQILVFNYMNHDTKVRVTLYNDKNQFDFLASIDEQENEIEPQLNQKEQIIDVIANGVSDVKFFITSKKAGNLILKSSAITVDDKAGDRVEKILKVKSEGQTFYQNKALLVNLKNSSEEQTVKLEFPENLVKGSRAVVFNAVKDILGTSMANLDDLVRMPYGCGEQNMVNFVVNIVVLEYLNKTNKLNERIKKKLINFTEQGYQRQLHYQRIDGSYSAFGEKDKQGSTWLTAFVLKSFIQAKSYVDIDTKVLNDTVKFLVKMGNSTTGTFNETGHVFSKALQGGSAKSLLPLNAYVLIALNKAKQNGLNVEFDLTKTENYLINEALNISLETDSNNLSHPNKYNYYQLAIINYALHEIGSMRKDDIHEKLLKLSQYEDNKLFFDEKKKKDQKINKKYPYFYIPASSNGIEATSYALLSLVQRQDYDLSLKILNWLISKQNSKGGFSSTQDTVIAIEALAEISSKLTSDTTEMNVDFIIKGLEKTNIKPNLKVNEDNALEQQTYQLSETNFEEEFEKINEVTINASGKGSGVVQVSWQYNLVVDSNDYFEINATAKSPLLENDILNENEFNLNVCVKYKKPGYTNMAVIEIEMPSGYVFKQTSVDNLKKVQYKIKRIEIKNSETFGVFYLDKIDENELCFSVESTRINKVAKLKPALIKVYDYYKTDENGRAYYLPNK